MQAVGGGIPILKSPKHRKDSPRKSERSPKTKDRLSCAFFGSNSPVLVVDRTRRIESQERSALRQQLSERMEGEDLFGTSVQDQNENEDRKPKRSKSPKKSKKSKKTTSKRPSKRRTKSKDNKKKESPEKVSPTLEIPSRRASTGLLLEQSESSHQERFLESRNWLHGVSKSVRQTRTIPLRSDSCRQSKNSNLLSELQQYASASAVSSPSPPVSPRASSQTAALRRASMNNTLLPTDDEPTKVVRRSSRKTKQHETIARASIVGHTKAQQRCKRASGKRAIDKWKRKRPKPRVDSDFTVDKPIHFESNVFSDAKREKHAQELAQSSTWQDEMQELFATQPQVHRKHRVSRASF